MVQPVYARPGHVPKASALRLVAKEQVGNSSSRCTRTWQQAFSRKEAHDGRQRTGIVNVRILAGLAYE